MIPPRTTRKASGDDITGLPDERRLNEVATPLKADEISSIFLVSILLNGLWLCHTVPFHL
jgi:hypothetical protein